MKSLFYVKHQRVKQNVPETCNFKIVANNSNKTIAYFLQHGRLFRSDIDISFSSCSCSLPTNSFGVFSQRKVHFSTVPAVCAKFIFIAWSRPICFWINRIYFHCIKLFPIAKLLYISHGVRYLNSMSQALCIIRGGELKPGTVPIAEILSGKNMRAWVSMVFT